ncbi:hypothetical protein TNCT_210031 [Trichonephila clavata]|uniref:Uncharacterized protein n=1 Tax=Trichonephila clavata TaxID=2740835 RepID=A0A8X6F0T1_TRICU|nr:hypothetical protein TNCT_210031 [Trichonephila clavata]
MTCFGIAFLHFGETRLKWNLFISECNERDGHHIPTASLLPRNNSWLYFAVTEIYLAGKIGLVLWIMLNKVLGPHLRVFLIQLAC